MQDLTLLLISLYYHQTMQTDYITCVYYCTFLQSTLTPTTTLVVLVCVISLSTRPGFVRTGSISLLPSLHQPQEESAMQEPGIRVYVQPRRATIHYGETVTIRCKARGGSTVADMPYIRFSVCGTSITAGPSYCHVLAAHSCIINKDLVHR